MVRRVRSGRARALRRPRTPDGGRSRARRRGRWAGPPPLLLLATVLALVAVPFVDDGGSGAATLVSAPRADRSAAPGPSPRSVEPRVVVPPRELPRAQAGRAGRGVAPVRPKPLTVGVATANMFRKLSVAEARQDALRVTGRRSVDVVGWQEADRFGRVLRRLPGWSTQTFRNGHRPSELAISWRTADWRLVGARDRVVAAGVPEDVGQHPFGDRQIVAVTLEHRETGRQLTVLDVHLPQAIEDLDHLGHWRPTLNAGRARSQLRRIAASWPVDHRPWVVATGDFNFDADGDRRQRPADGPRAVVGRVAVSSYMALGTGTGPTFPGNGRHIDYVWVDRRGYADRRVRFAGQSTLGGLHSDHNSLLARLVLS